jgi:murein DD-endopeptidase MepM/ murein hydrolase activator NlpD
MPTLTAAQVAQYSKDAGFSGDSLITALAVSKGESGWNSGAMGDLGIQTSKWGPSVGLFQIRCLKEQIGTKQERDCDALKDPAFNARAAYKISNRGTNWNPWTVYTHGTYKQFLDVARETIAKYGSALSSFLPPLKGDFRITTPYGAKAALGGKIHDAIDYSAPSGTPVYAANDGTVSFAGWNQGGGNLVEIGHGDNISTGYAHLQRFVIKQGDKVKRGQLIGYVGSTGEYTTGPHLHFYAKRGEAEFNPVDLFSLESVTDAGDYLGDVIESFLQDKLEDDIEAKRTWGEWSGGLFNADFIGGPGKSFGTLVGKAVEDLGWSDKVIKAGDIPEMAAAISGFAENEASSDPLSIIAGSFGDIGQGIGAVLATLFDVMFWARLFALIAGAVLTFVGWQTMWRTS